MTHANTSRAAADAARTLCCELAQHQTLGSADLLGRKLLVMGDINAGKTTRCRQWLALLCEQGLGARITILDLAPHIPPDMAQARGLAGAGGYLRPPANSGVLDLRTHLHAPRLSSATEAEAQAKAESNACAIDGLLQQLPPPASGRDILFINDVTLYLQAGRADELLAHIARPHISTLIVNGYWGQRLGDSALSRREREQTQQLRAYFAQHGWVWDVSF